MLVMYDIINDIIVFENFRFRIRTSTRKREASVFKTLHSGERLQVWTVGQIEEKISVSKKYGICTT